MPARPNQLRWFLVLFAILAPGIAHADYNDPPDGFTALFNGKDLSGWKGLVANPIKRAAMTADEHASAQREADDAIRQHWRVEGGEIINDGAGPHLCTDRPYGDFEMWIDWKISPKSDSGIYLRGSPQVQIWDPVDGIPAAKVGSGGLYNNQKNRSTPLVVADRPAGEWNTFFIRMIGERVKVTLNGQLVADDVPMENYWDRSRSIFPREQIELQTHGGEIRFRSIFIREIPPAVANLWLQVHDDDGFKTIFNGLDLTGWRGSVLGYDVENGVLTCNPERGGTLFTVDEYGDFVLRFEFKLPPGGNNGLAIRAPLEGNPAYEGMELQILDNTAEKFATLQPYQYHGSVYGVVPAQRGYLRPVGQWNLEEVTCRGSRVTVRVNGTTITDVDTKSIDAPMDGQAHPGLKRRMGHIGFMGHGDPVAFRNIRIKPLSHRSRIPLGRMTMRTTALKLLLVLCAGTPAFAHDPQDTFDRDYGLLARWVFRPADVGSRLIDSTAGNAVATLHGDLSCVAAANGAALLGEGMTGWAEVTNANASGALPLPKRAMTVSAWVQVERPSKWGGILGYIQDNGDFEKGWVLGYIDDHFSFALSSGGADDGDGRMTYMKAEDAFAPSRWYHVAATYDGVTMRLYVNGREAATGVEQSGDIVYPDAAPFALGGYRDDNEHYPLEGAIQHVRLYDRCLDAHAIENAMQAAPNMIDAAALRIPYRMIVGPYLQASTQTSMTVMFETNRPGAGVVEYGAAYPLAGRESVNTTTGMHEIRLSGLAPETQYFYRVSATSDDGAVASAGDYTFKTTVRDDSAFAFIVMSDTQNNPLITKAVSDHAWGHRPNFIIHCGDLVGTGEIKREWVYEFFGASNELLRRFPLFPTLGNHERDAQLYYDYFSLPGPEYYYDYRYGNAHFFVLDTNKDVSPASDQYQWFARELAASTATWKIVYHHQPAFTSDSNDYGDTYKEASTFGDTNIQTHLVPLYERHDVDVVFNGHIHVYERTWPLRGGAVDQENGVVYLTAGGAGGSLEDFAPTRTGFSAHAFRGHHYCFVTVHGGSFNLKAYDVDGKMFDTLELRR